MATVVLDSDFLSSFLKIKQLPLVRGFYQTETLWVPTAVYREVAVTTLLPDLAALDWVKMQTPTASQLEKLSEDSEFPGLGAGEKEAIALTKDVEESTLLVNDKQALRCARRLGVTAVNVPAFLLACKESGFSTTAMIRAVVADLQEKDCFGFQKDVLDLLLK